LFILDLNHTDHGQARRHFGGTQSDVPSNHGHGLGIMPVLLAEGLGLLVNPVGGPKFVNLRDEVSLAAWLVRSSLMK
jgi:hypothetical protein